MFIEEEINMGKELTHHQILCHTNYEKNKEIKNEEKKKIKTQCLSNYSNGFPKCSYPGCNIDDIEVLTIDHINGGGRQEARARNHQNIYKFLIDNDFPEGYRVLCFNHNFKEAHTKHFLEKNREKRARRGELITGRLARIEKIVNELDLDKDKLIKKYEYLIEKALRIRFGTNNVIKNELGKEEETKRGNYREDMDKIVEQIYLEKEEYYSISRKNGTQKFLDVNLIRYKYITLSFAEAKTIKALVEKKIMNGEKNGTTKTNSG